MRAILLLFLCGCSPALQWRPPAPEVRDRVYCETRGAHKQCWNMTREELERKMDEVMGRR